MEILSPFAPLFPWLFRDHRLPGFLYRIFPEDCRPLGEADIGTPSDRLIDGIDLRELATRAVVLRALAAHGHARPWALGEGFGSDLTAEQAGRVVAEMVRRVGPDPGKPVGVIPTFVSLPWVENIPNRYWLRRQYNATGGGPMAGCWANSGTPGDNCGWAVWTFNTTHASGAEGGALGRDVCDLAIRNMGGLLWEQVTPPCP